MTNLMHALFGNGPQGAIAGTMASPLMAQNTGSLQTPPHYKSPGNKKVFHGLIEVTQVANGFIVNIGRKEGYEFDTHIATTITEVNEIIAAQIVAFKLEDKS
jgi:hypothetical protein